VNCLDKVIEVDQQPIGRTPRSNPATYTKVWDIIRTIFSELPESKTSGYGPGRFSFNVKGGRCEHCQGDGVLQIEMHFLADVYVPCDICHGRRFNAQTLEIRYKGKSIADVLDLTVDEALELFSAYNQLSKILRTLQEVGLGYIQLGQPATTLSGGEAQRIKLAKELARPGTGKTLYVLDEPTTGLHFDDVAKLIAVLQRLCDKGNSVLVIEHHLDVIAVSDHLIDMGPEGGDGGGQLVAQGSPEVVANVAASYTGAALRAMQVPLSAG
jgi:excinuclease ABC subunit A